MNKIYLFPLVLIMGLLIGFLSLSFLDLSGEPREVIKEIQLNVQ